MSWTIQAAVAAKVRFATHQNAIPVIRDLMVTAPADGRAKDLVLTLCADPPFVQSKTWRIDAMEPCDEITIADSTRPCPLLRRLDCGELLSDADEARVLGCEIEGGDAPASVLQCGVDGHAWILRSFSILALARSQRSADVRLLVAPAATVVTAVLPTLPACPAAFEAKYDRISFRNHSGVSE